MNERATDAKGHRLYPDSPDDSEQHPGKPDPENEFRRDPQFFEVVKTLFIGALITGLSLIAYFGCVVSYKP